MTMLCTLLFAVSLRIYRSIAHELGYTLILKSHVHFIRSKVMAEKVNFLGREKWTFLTFAGCSLRPDLVRVARLDAL